MRLSKPYRIDDSQLFGQGRISDQSCERPSGQSPDSYLSGTGCNHLLVHGRNLPSVGKGRVWCRRDRLAVCSGLGKSLECSGDRLARRSGFQWLLGPAGRSEPLAARVASPAMPSTIGPTRNVEPGPSGGSTDPMEVDVVVVGAGTAGANVAQQLAGRGLSVVLVERRSIHTGGARWHNGVLPWQFRRAGLEPPQPPELYHSAGAFHMFGPSGNHVFTVVDPPTVTADMALLGDRLRSMCVERGVVMIDQVDELRTSYEGDRLVGVQFTGHRVDDMASVAARGSQRSAAVRDRFSVRARLFVDASGRSGVLRRTSTVLERWCPTLRKDELCSASDFRFHIADRAGAEEFLWRHDAAPGDNINTVGLAGGYSTRNMSISEDLTHVSVLVGCVANGRYGTGPQMLEQVRRSEPWIGEPIGGGSGVIPLRRPYARFTAPGLALVGDAACQVFPAHGSGIGMGLIAGRILADAVTGPSSSATARPTARSTYAPHGTDGATGRVDEPVHDIGNESVLWRYQHAFMSEFGGLLIAFDAFRRMSTSLGSNGVDQLMRAELVNEKMTRAGLDQRLATPDPVALPAMAVKLLTRPRLSADVVPMLLRVQILRMLGPRHPATPDLAALGRWDRSVERVLGTLPS